MLLEKDARNVYDVYIHFGPIWSYGTYVKVIHTQKLESEWHLLLLMPFWMC